MRQSARYPLAVFTALVLANAVFAQDPDLSSLDENSDDKISLAEFEAYAETRLDGFDKLELFAQKVDANSDGDISQDEFDNRMEILQQINRGEFDEMEDKEESEKVEKVAPAKTNTPTPADKDQSGAVEVFNKIKAHIKKNEWQTAASLMTNEAADRTAVQLVISGLGMQNIELPMPMPKFEDAIDDVDAVLGKYRLDKLGIDAPAMLKIEIGTDRDDEEKAETEIEDKAQQENNSKKILAALDKDGKRWQIVGELWDVISSSPFGLNPLVGKAEQVTLNGDNAVLEVKALPPSVDEQPGMMIQIVAPPMFLNFEKSNKEWKYAGRNEKKIAESIKDFPADMGGSEIDDEVEIEPDLVEGIKPLETIKDPAFTGTTVDGKPFKLADLKGKLVVVNLWHTKSPSSIQELAVLKVFHDAFHQHGLEIVGVAKDKADAMKSFMGKNKTINWLTLVDSDGTIAEQFEIKSFPTTLLIDKNGNHVGTNLSKNKLMTGIVSRLELDAKDFTDFKKKLRKLSRPKAVDGVDY